MLKIFLKPKPFKNLPIPTATQIQARNIAKAATSISKTGKKFGVKKPTMWIILHGSNSG